MSAEVWQSAALLTVKMGCSSRRVEERSPGSYPMYGEQGVAASAVPHLFYHVPVPCRVGCAPSRLFFMSLHCR